MKTGYRLSVPNSDSLWAAIQSGKLYSAGTFSKPHIDKRIQDLANHPALGEANGKASTHRLALQTWLKNENKFAELSEAQKESLANAGKSNSVFILTGQQPGLLGGPLLTVLKALTTAALTKRYATALQKPVIPLFWIAGDDADLEEANTSEFIWPNDDVTLALRLHFANATQKIPVGARTLSELSSQTLLESLPYSWPEALREKVIAAYAPGKSIVQGFKDLLQPLLAESGILFIDGRANELHELAHPFFRKVLKASPTFFEALRESEKQLKNQGFKPQVELPPRALPGFSLVNGIRDRLTSELPEGHGRLPDLTVPITHDALSRPLLCEAVFPLLGHVLGPAETSYFVQLEKVFEVFTGSKPLIHPRQSALFVPEKLAKKLTQLGIPAEQWTKLSPDKLRGHMREWAWQKHPASQNSPQDFFLEWSEQALAWQARNFPNNPMPQSLLRRLEFALNKYEKSLKRMSLSEAEATGLLPTTQETIAWLRPLAKGLGQDRHLTALSLQAAFGKAELQKLLGSLEPEFIGTQIVVIPERESA